MFINLTIERTLNSNDCTRYTSHQDCKEREVSSVQTVEYRDKDSKDCKKGGGNATRGDVLLSTTRQANSINNERCCSLSCNRCHRINCNANQRNNVSLYSNKTSTKCTSEEGPLRQFFTVYCAFEIARTGFDTWAKDCDNCNDQKSRTEGDKRCLNAVANQMREFTICSSLKGNHHARDCCEEI